MTGGEKYDCERCDETNIPLLKLETYFPSGVVAGFTGTRIPSRMV